MLLSYHNYRCNICDKKFSCGHMGRQDVVKHSHGKIYGEIGYNCSVYVTTISARYEAELKMAVLATSSNIPLFNTFDTRLSSLLDAKMNPVTVRIYDLNHNKVTTKFLEMCACPSFHRRRLHLMWSRQHFSEYWYT